MNMKLKKKLAVILSLVTVFSAAFTSMAEIPAEAIEPVEIAEISSDQVVITNTEEATVLEVEEVVEDNSKEALPKDGSAAQLVPLTGTASGEGWSLSDEGVLTIDGTVTYMTEEAPWPWNEYCSSITSVVAESGATVNKCRKLFQGCQNLKSVNLDKLDISNVTDMAYMFHGCGNLIELDLSGFNMLGVTNMSQMFYGCNGLIKLDLSGFNTSDVTNMVGMFYNCQNLTSLDLTGFNTKKISYASNMFYGCKALKTIYASEAFDLSSATVTQDMFKDCTSLVGGAGTVFDSSKVDKTYARIDVAGTPGYFTAITIADILPDDFPNSTDNAWVNGKGGKAYASDFYINFVGPKWTFCPEIKSTLDKTDNGYSYADRYGQILFNMAGDELQSITIKDYTADDAVNGTYMKEVVITDLEVTKAPDKTAYKEGEKFDPAGVELTLTYNNGLTRTVSFDSDDIKMTPDGELKASDKQIEFSVTVDGVTLTAAQPITVNLALVVLTGVEITKAPSRTVYTEGESFDPTGMTVTAVYSNGKTEAVTDYQITPAGALKTADKEVEISYTNGVTVTAKQSITVNTAKKPDPTPSRDDDHEPLYTGTWNSPVKSGSWSQDANGIWHYTSSEIFRNTWGYIVNPYATEGQHTADWFWFDRQGNMLTGWQFIGGKWYYLNPTKDGTLGACQLGGVTPDGWTVDESGAWIESIPKK